MTRFRNYKNKYTKNNVIHSIDNIVKMPFGNVAKRDKELTSQYKQIGFPTDKELQSSSNVVYVHEYTKDDGTFVHAHWRSKPEGTGYNDPGSDPVTPDTIPTKAPEGVPDDGGDEKGRVVYDFLKWLLIILQIYQLMKSDGIDGNNSVPLDINIKDTLGNSTDSDNLLIPAETNSSGVNVSENERNTKSLNDELDTSIIPREEQGSPFSITPHIPKEEENTQKGQWKMTADNKTTVDKKEPVLSFEGEKTSEVLPMNQPMAQHSDDDLKEYINTLVNSSQKKNPWSFISNITNSLKDFGKGGAQNYGSILEGIERRYTDSQRNKGNNLPNDFEIKNKYSKLYGLPSDSNAYNIGKLLSEILLLLSISAITIDGFPAIVTFMLYSAVQILSSKAIEYARYENEKKFTDGLVNNTANYFLTELFTRGIVKAGDKTTILNVLKEKLRKLWKDIKFYATETFGQPIRQANGTIIFKRYNGDTATPEEVAERIIQNLRKYQKEQRKEREFIKKDLQNNLKEFKINGNTYKQIRLSDSEYEAVHSAFTTYIMHTHYTEPILKKEYGDYVYTAILEWIEGQPLPVFVKKIKIKGVKR